MGSPIGHFVTPYSDAATYKVRFLSVCSYTRQPVFLTRSIMTLQLKSTGLCALLLFCLSAVRATNDDSDGLFQYTNGPVPDVFQVNQSYPNRTEIEECMPIQLRIERNSRSYSDLVVNTNSDIDFANSDARRMTSRMRSRLDALVVLFYREFSARITVLKTWTEYPDEDVDDQSLHFEGRRVCRAYMYNYSGRCMQAIWGAVYLVFF